MPHEPPMTEADEVRRDLKSLALSWECLRILYNIVLLAIGYFLTAHLLPSHGAAVYWTCVVLYALLANTLYSLGPLLEFYLYLFGVRLDVLRYLMFTGGLLVSILVVYLAAGTHALPGK